MATDQDERSLRSLLHGMESGWKRDEGARGEVKTEEGEGRGVRERAEERNMKTIDRWEEEAGARKKM